MRGQPCAFIKNKSTVKRHVCKWRQQALHSLRHIIGYLVIHGCNSGKVTTCRRVDLQSSDQQIWAKEKFILDCQSYVLRTASNFLMRFSNVGRSLGSAAQHWSMINFTSCGQSLGQGNRRFLSKSFMSTITVICPWVGAIISQNFFGGYWRWSQRVRISYKVTPKDQMSEEKENLLSFKHSMAYQNTGLSPCSRTR